MIAPRMSATQMNFDKAYIAVLLIIRKGLVDIGIPVDHGQFFWYPWEQCALDRDGQQNNTEYQIKDMVFGFYAV